MTTRLSLLVVTLMAVSTHVSEAATLQLFASQVDSGLDLDADTYNGFNVSVGPTLLPGGGFDFDDNDLHVNPGAFDGIDGLDNDQDGVIDGNIGAHSINALPDLILSEGDSFTADWIVEGIDSLANVYLQAFPDGATYSQSLTDPLEITATVGWTAQPGDAGNSYLFRIAAPDFDEFTVTVVPEPSTLVLGGLGFMVLTTIAWMRGGGSRMLFSRRRGC